MKQTTLSWINPKVRTRERETTGKGLYAHELIGAGEIVVVQGGRIIGNSQIDHAENLRYSEHCFQIEKGFFIGPADSESPVLEGAFLMNHSCNPSCGLKGQISFVSMRDIYPGEQLTFDHAMTDATYPGAAFEDVDIDCRCGSDMCRNKITHSDWQRKELQDRYKGYFSMYVQSLIDEWRRGH